MPSKPPDRSWQNPAPLLAAEALRVHLRCLVNILARVWKKSYTCAFHQQRIGVIYTCIYIYISLSLFLYMCMYVYIYILSLSLSLPLSLSLAIYNKRMSHPLKKLCILRLSLLWGLGPLHQRGCAQPPSGGSGLLLKSYFSADLCCIFWLKTSQNHINSYIYIYIQINKSIDK